jgi:hypothetical protein
VVVPYSHKLENGDQTTAPGAGFQAEKSSTALQWIATSRSSRQRSATRDAYSFATTLPCWPSEQW